MSETTLALRVEFQYQSNLFAQYWKLEASQLLIANLLPGPWIEDSVMIVLIAFMDVVISQYWSFPSSAAAWNPCHISVPYPTYTAVTTDETNLKRLVNL